MSTNLVTVIVARYGAFYRRIYEAPDALGIMNKIEVEGKGRQIMGKVREVVGKMTDNKTEQVKGKDEQVEGKARENLGKAQRRARKD